MRQPLRRNVARAQTAVTRPIPFPAGGWDTDSPLAAMKPTHAVILDNMIPRGGYGELRRGYIEQSTGTSDPVETLMPYRGDPAGDKLFACAGSDIYDVTDAGALPAADYAAAVSARWNHTNFANEGGAFLIACNGAQEPIRYNGTNWSALSISGTSGAITLDAADLMYVMAHKGRLHFIEKETLRVWFLGVSAIQGAATLFDLGPQFNKGGYLVGAARLTLDGGQGPDDFAAYLTSEGQVALYQGYDPSDANAWALVGVYNLPKPIGDRCLLESGTDLLVLTEVGLLPLSVALRTPEELLSEISLTKKVNTAVADAARDYGDLFGWQVLSYPGRGGLIIVNSPTEELVSGVQFVRSQQSGGWCRFTGVPAFCWAYANGEIYFGSTAGVYRWDVGASDNGEPIVADVLPAFQDFGNRAVTKNFTMMRALLKCPAILRPALEMVVGYDTSTIPTDIQTVVAPEDISPEDSNLIRDDWTGAAGEGYVGAPRMRLAVISSAGSDRVAVTSDASELLLVGPGGTDKVLLRPNLPLDVSVQCVGFDVMFRPGGVLG